MNTHLIIFLTKLLHTQLNRINSRFLTLLPSSNHLILSHVHSTSPKSLPLYTDYQTCRTLASSFAMKVWKWIKETNNWLSQIKALALAKIRTPHVDDRRNRRRRNKFFLNFLFFIAAVYCGRRSSRPKWLPKHAETGAVPVVFPLQ